MEAAAQSYISPRPSEGWLDEEALPYCQEGAVPVHFLPCSCVCSDTRDRFSCVFRIASYGIVSYRIVPVIGTDIAILPLQALKDGCDVVSYCSGGWRRYRHFATTAGDVHFDFVSCRLLAPTW